MKNKKELPDLIISVESRKGGVGKTTAALCMARLLLKKNYAVLFLDLDVTGTNAADIAKSPFWVNDLHIIQGVQEINDESTDKETLNLITLFDQRFMAGKTIPQFSTEGASSDTLRVDFTKVNVLGSQIYKTDKEGRNNIGATCIERPSILFDDLHTLWLLELVKQISNDFVRAGHSNQFKKPKRYAVILDNSPGYVGIAPAIHEWLTDLGPKNGKFLTVTSLDTQDLHACDQAIDTLHNLYIGKWQISLLFLDGSNKGSGIKVGQDQEAFFMRLATSTNGGSGSVDSLSFYRETEMTPLHQQEGQRFCEQPSEYIAAIINRVPRSVKEGHLDYEFPSVLTQRHTTLARVLKNRDENQDWRDRMISYDEYIENQFLLQYLRRGRRNNERSVHHLIDVIKMAEEELGSSILNESNDRPWFYEIEQQYHKELKTQIDKANNIVSRVRSAIEDAEFSHLARLIPDKWLSGSILPDFRRTLLRYLRESDFPYFEMKPFEFDYNPTESESHEFMVEIKKRIRMDLHNYQEWGLDSKNLQTPDILMNVLIGLVGLSLTSSLWHSPMGKEISGLFAGVLTIELKHWARRGEEKAKRFGPQRFLAQESISEGELHKDMEMFESLRFFRRHMMEEGDVNFIDFYRACTNAQARLIDFVSDSRFLLQLLLFMVNGEMKKGDLFPFVRGIAEDVIIKKTLTHEDAPGKMAKALQSAEYFKDFEKILNEILKVWGVEHE